MSSLIVNVCTVDEVKPHPDADRMALGVIKGWTVCIGRNPDTGATQFKPGDLCVYFPPDTVMPDELADRLGVKKYLQPLKEGGNRIKVARLRGHPSYGLIASTNVLPSGRAWAAGDSVVEALGLTKYDPPQPCTDGDAERPHPAFHKYTGIENYRNFPDVIKDGEEVVFTEKLHGKNTRLGLIRDQGDDGEFKMTFMAGSHEVRRKEITVLTKTVRDSNKEPVLDDKGEVQKTTETRRSQFWDCFGPEDSPEGVRKLLQYVSREHGDANVVLFGEMIGQGVQDMTYGVKFGFRAFDITVNGQYLDYDVKLYLFNEFKVEMVPALYRGPFSKAKVEEFVDGPTTMCSPEYAGAFKGREGIVITPTKERRDMDLGGDGRVILKAVSFGYLERKGGSEYH